MHLHFRVEGEGSPVVILHGLLGSLDNWRGVSRRLTRDFKVFRVDLRNHGQSPHSEIMNYPTMARDLREFIDHHELSPVIVLGHSMGGKVAMQLANDSPERVEKLIIVDVAPKAYPPTHRSLLAALRDLDLTAFQTFGAIDAAVAPLVGDAATRQFLLKSLTRNANAGFRWKIDLDAILQNYDELTKPIVLARTFSKPVLFIRGARSNYIENGDARLIRQMFPRAEIIDIPDAGHWAHTDAPDAFHSAVTEFLHRH
jgi:esterase